MDDLQSMPLVSADGSASSVARVRIVDASDEGAAAAESWSVRKVQLGARYGGHRRAPLLQVLETTQGNMLVVGTWLIWIIEGQLEFVALVRSLSVESAEWQRVIPDAALLAELAPAPFTSLHASATDDPQELLTTVAKATAEASRNAVAKVRDVRYGLETRVRASLSDDSVESPSRALPALIGLRLAVSQARDEARECTREGLMLWRDDDEAYQRYRRHRDGTIINQHEPADVHTRPWMRAHDAGVRQCEALDRLLGEEIAFLAGMLDSAGTIAMVRESEAADTLNKVASAVALGLGLPSLVLAYYGADSLFNLSGEATAASIALLLLPAVAAVASVRDHLPGDSRRVRTLVATGAIVALLVLLLLVVAFTRLGVPET